MLKKTLILASLTLTGLVAAPAFADNGWHHGHYKHHPQYRPYVYYVPAPVVYAPPPPVVYYPAPAPVYYPSASVRVVPAPGVSVRFNFPL